MSGLTIPQITADQWTQRLLALFPQDWVSDAAKQPGGVLNALFEALGGQLTTLQGNVIYAQDTSRIATATGDGLVAVSTDFFGDTLPKLPGENDTSFRQRIESNLLLTAVTRAAISNRIELATGNVPRLAEPWSIIDTCGWDLNSYWDIDTVENSFRWGTPELRYQGFADIQLPQFANQGQNPVWALDDGFSWDTAPGVWWDSSPTWFIQTEQLDQLLQSSKAWGTTIWRRYESQALVTYPVGGTFYASRGAFSCTPSILPFAGPYTVIAQASWNTNCYVVAQNQTTFTIGFDVPAPSGGTVDWCAIPFDVVGSDVLPIAYGSTSNSLVVPAGYSSYTPMVTPNWPTPYWLASQTSSLDTIGWANAAAYGASFGYMLFPPVSYAATAMAGVMASGSVSPASGSANIAISMPSWNRVPFQIFLMPSWNTTFSIVKTAGLVTVSFANYPPSGATLQWALFLS